MELVVTPIYRCEITPGKPIYNAIYKGPHVPPSTTVFWAVPCTPQQTCQVQLVSPPISDPNCPTWNPFWIPFDSTIWSPTLNWSCVESCGWRPFGLNGWIHPANLAVFMVVVLAVFTYDLEKSRNSKKHDHQSITKADRNHELWVAMTKKPSPETGRVFVSDMKSHENQPIRRSNYTIHRWYKVGPLYIPYKYNL